ncbi:MAG: cupin domain-containing protein [Bacteroidia bacterium]|nr:cupin domain-containing protein [Bacteroidia bacterium]
MEKENLIKNLGLLPHPEGGFYRETYRSGLMLPTGHGPRNLNTIIYFLLENQNFSAFHRIRSDEAWFHHAGSTAEIYILLPDGTLEIKYLGGNLQKGDQLQVVVPANCWFASKVPEYNAYMLASCSVSPGFDFADFEIAERAALLSAYPQHREIICSLTR